MSKTTSALFGLFTILSTIFILASSALHAQTSTEFWLAPPYITPSHAGTTPVFVRLSAGDEPAEVTISMPANPGFNGGSPILVSLAANSSQSINMNTHVPELMTNPPNTVLNTGLKIESTEPITAIYEVSPTNNPDIYALKGLTGLGTEFFVPLQNIWPNGSYATPAYTSFDIVATEDNTTILILPTSDLDGGQDAFQTFTITLNEGQTYSASVTGSVAANNPTGSIILSDKDIAVSIKDDSVQPTGAGCRDLQGDQLVPIEIIGNEYIVIRGGLNNTINEWAFAVATQNNTQISVNGTPDGAPMFAGQTKVIQITNTNPRTYITANKDFYLVHVSGFGCETGIALLPPLACAGSEQVSFTRSTNESFFLNLLVPSGAEGSFVLNGDADIIDAGDFDPVPGTGGQWVGAQIQFTTGQIASGVANLLTNTQEPFALGLINGGASSGCRYGYFSEFAAPIVVDAGPDQNVCANRETLLNGSISGGATQGVWSTNGTGAFIPDEFALDATYEPSLADLSAGVVTLTLTSVSNCFPVSDQVVINYNPAPIVDAGAPISACENNTAVSLNGFVDIATGALWSGGSGSFSPSPAVLGATYTPTAAEVESGSLWLFLTTTGNGNCFAEVDSVEITWGPPPVADAGEDMTVCANNATVTLSGSVTGAGGGQWSGGAGFFTPSNQSLGAAYSPSPTEIANGFVTLTLTTTDNGGCLAVTDQVTIFIDPAPTVDAGAEQNICRNNADIQLNGSVAGAGGGIWSGGAGTFTPGPNALDAVYTPTAGELLLGGITLTLTSTDNGDCLPVQDQVTFNFTNPPVVSAGADANICENNSTISLNGSLIGANFGLWDGGLGTFSPNTTTLNATYTPTADEIENGSVTLTLTSLDNGNCNAVTDEVTFTFTPAPTASAGADIFTCSNNPATALNGSVTVAGGGQWSGGNGSFSPDNTALGATYNPTAAEISNGSVTLTLTTSGNGNCTAVSDQVLITFTDAPTANAGPDQILCANNAEVNLSGVVSVAGGGQWTGGLGTFSNGSTGLTNTYTPTTTEINSGSLTLTLTTTDNGNCSAVSDNIAITFTPSPVVDAGTPISVCSNNAQVNLSGSVDVAGGGQWSGGSGTFFPNANALNALYTPTAAEIASGSLNLTLTSTGNGNCNPVTDFVTITFTPAPTANAGADVTVCANNPGVNLNGSIGIATGGIWSGGSGTFNPSNTSLGATYIPSAAEIANGSTTLTLTTTGNANCNAVSDQMTITITPAPVVDAGAGGELCANNAVIDLAGSVTIADGGSWSGGNGTFSPNSNTLDAAYTPSQGEINSGSLTLTLTSTGNGNCVAVTDEVTYTFSPAPTADAGANQTLCGNNAEAQLNGAVSIATGGTWSGGDGNFSPSANALNAFYVPSPEEIAAGSVTLTLTTTGNGDCNPVTDNVTLTYTPAPTANAGADRVRCANNPEVELNGSVTVATGGTWTGGTGTFDPDANTLGATYTPSEDEIEAGSVTLTLTTTGNANCNPVSDNMTITYTPAPIVNAGVGGELCANNAVISLDGSVAGATGGSWSGGNGTFSPNSNALDATYTPSQGEINSGILTLTLTSTGNGNCIAVTDEVTYTFSPAPTADAGPNQTLCGNNAEAQLGGAVTIATGGTWSGGDGSFSPSANALGAFYVPSPEEITAGSVTLTLTTTGNGLCNAVTDEVTINYTPAPTANAGVDQTVCANNQSVTLNGSVTVAGGGAWSGGTGTFSPDANTLGATYTPSAAEIAAGTVTLTLTTTSNGNCNPVSDNMTITITPAPIVDAGAGGELCANNAVIALEGSVAGAAGGSWSGGNGTFSPNSSTLDAQYTPSQGEINGGILTLTLTSTGNGNCIAVTDEVIYTFSPAPTADAGPNQTLCGNNAEAQLDGAVTVATGGTWSGGNGNFSPSANALDAFYVPSPEEIAAGSVTLTLTTTGNDNCNPVSDNMTITYTPAPTANAGADRVRCANNPEVELNGSVTVATGGTWSGGTGTFDPDANTLGATYTPSAAEIAAGTVTLTLTTTGNGNCNAVSDNMTITITPAPVVDAGAGGELCANNAVITLDGSVTIATGGAWSGGNGVFSPDANTLDAAYTPSQGEINSGSLTLTLTSTGNGTCIAVTDEVTYTFSPAPTADAGANQTLCGNNAEAQLDGNVTIATGGTWSGGNGSFSPSANALDAFYVPTPEEIAAGSVTLTLTTTGNDNCNAVSDNMTITYTPAPTANAGTDRVRCANNPEVELNGSVTIATGGTWSGGTGTFDPDANTLGATYTPSAAEIAAGAVTLTLTTTGNGTCNPVSDNMTITITPAPIVDAGVGGELCANNALINLDGSVTGATGGSWSGGNGTFSPNSNTLDAIYTPSQGEINGGSITLTLTSTGNGNCIAVTDEVTYTFSPAPTADAGPNQTLCGNNAEAQLDGAVTIATGGTWSGGNGSFSPSANALDAFYVPSPEEIAAGSVTLTLTTTGNGDCNAVTDEVTINYTPAPTANAGADQTVCANNPNVLLSGSVTVATGGTWSGGAGTFSPDANTLGATYTPSAGEIAAGTVTLTLTTTANGNCNSVSDNVTITITPAPEVDAGAGGEVCSNNPAIALSGAVTIATGGAWSGGNGTFDPDANDLNAIYIPTQGEINNGSVTLTLTSTGNGNCTAVTDQVTYTFGPSPTADAGANQTLCANNAEVQLNGSVTIASGGTWSGGAGTFSPSANALDATYSPTAAEIGNGSLTLVLTTTGNGDCNPVTDEVTITFTPAPIANAGADQAVCANNPQVILAGSVTNANGGTWSGGNGTYFPDANSLGASYTPTPGEIAAGTVTLTLTTTGIGNCLPESDQMTITITPPPVVDAGADFEICENNNVFSLNGSVTNAGGGQWSGGNGLYDPSPNALDATYTPTLSELVSGSITFTLTSTDNGGCLPETDQVTVTFTPPPTVDAGEDITVCATAPNASLNGAFTVATGIQWSGGSGVFSPNPLVANATYIPTAAEISSGSVTLTLTTTGNGNCNAVSDEITIFYTPAPTVNAGADLLSCANNANVVLDGSFTNASGVQWSGGTGFYNPSSTSPTATYTPSNADILNGGVTLTLTTTGTGACPPASDEVSIVINPAPVVNAGADISVCANNSLAQLNGAVTFAGGGQWTGGAGVFSPSANALGATYQATPAEIANGFVTLTLTSTGNGTCNPVSDQVTITFTPAPIVDAGNDISVCANNPAVQLNGSFTVSEGASWSGGAGSFSPGSSDMNAVYTPSQGEISNGTVTLTLTSFGNGNCLPVSDQVTITITPAPEVDAGEDIFACVDALTVPLDGSVTGPTNTGVWSSSGTGTFVPTQFNLNASYIASSQDSLNGEVVLTLTSTNNGLCTPVTDALTIFISPAGTANAGPDQVVCANNSNVVLNGVIGGAANSGFWETSGTGIFTPSANITNPNYLPSEADIANGNVTLTFFVNSCNQAFDEMNVTITPSPVVDAGEDLTVCAADGDVALNGSVGGASSTGQWTTTGSGTFTPSANDLNATYIFSQADIDAQSVELTLTATNIGNCVSVSETITLNIFPQGTAGAGPDIVACANNAEVEVNGTLTGADLGEWTSSGSGTFSPDANALAATYIPSEDDIAAGSVNLIFTALNSCNPASDFLVLSFTPAPIVDAGADQEVCGEVIPFQITGNVSNAGGGQWTSSGSGSFQNANNLNTFYVASQADIDAGTVVLTLTSTDFGNCLAVSDEIVLSISTGIVVDAGPDREVCSESGTTDLFGSVSNGATTGVWSTTGNGTFSPSAGDLNATYNFTQNDIDAGSVVLTLTSTDNGICEEASDSFVLTFGNTAFVFAGEDVTFCETQELFPISGQVSGETNTGTWTTSGDGSFLPTANALNTFYEPGPVDVALGSVTLTLTSTGSTLCSEGSSSRLVTFQPLPTANAGANALICGDIEPVQLLGTVEGATGGTWSTAGSGSFFPDENVLSAIYTPSAADSAAGSVVLTLTTTGNALCAAGTDQMTIGFSDAVIPNAGPNQEVCETQEVISLTGQLTGAGSITWASSGSGSFDPSTQTLSTGYLPSQADIESGSITLYLIAETAGNCPGLTDSLTVVFDRLPQIDVNPNFQSCTTSESVTLSANVAFQDAVLWTSSGGGTFEPNANVANVTYIPTQAEIATGAASLTFAATSNGACGSVEVPVQVTFIAPASVDAGGASLEACSTDLEVALNGSVTGSTNTGVWSTTGFGTFDPDETTLDGTYVFGANDILLGFANLTLTSTNNGPCAAVSETIQLIIDTPPVVNAGADIFACSNAGSIELSGTITNGTFEEWITTGDGVFIPGETDLTPAYITGINDEFNQGTQLILVASGNGSCPSVSDTLELSLTTPLAADFTFGRACTGSPVSFTDQTEVFSGNAVGWTWDFGDGSIATTQNPSFTFTEPGNYNVSLVVLSSLGCTDTTTQAVSVTDSPIASITADMNPAPINGDILFTNTSVGATTVLWDMGDGFGTFNTPTVVYAYPEEGSFTVSLVATSAGGCTDSTSLVITIDGRLILPPRLPNTFSPNGDGLNDVFFVRGGPFTTMDFKVYNNWGQEIFATTNQEEGWDGTQDGEQLPIGVYVYTLKAANVFGETFDLSGKINLLR